MAAQAYPAAGRARHLANQRAPAPPDYQKETNMNRAWDIAGLVITAGIVAVLARNPRIVANFFEGSSKLLGTALAGGK